MNDIGQTMKNIVACVGIGKRLIVSVPFQYPRHDCPIDNLWRPSGSELADFVALQGLDVMFSCDTAPETFGKVERASAAVVLAGRV